MTTTTRDGADLLGPNGALARALPCYEHRPQQEEVCRAIDDAMSAGRHCLVEAGTGVGKSIAYLIPAVRAISRGKKVVISTHTINLQVQLLEKDIPLAQGLFPNVSITPALMKGRGNYLCLQDLDSAEADLFKATDPLFRKIKRWVRKTDTGDRADLPFVYDDWHEVAANADTCRHQECRYYDRCFYYRMRWAAQDANLFVVNHALFLSDLALRHGGVADPNSAILPDYDCVVFDEAHRLEEVATGVFGVEMSNRRIPHFLDRLRRTRDIDIDTLRLDSVESASAGLFDLFDGGRAEFYFHDVLDEEADAAAKDLAAQAMTGLEGIGKELLERARDTDSDTLRDRLQGLARMGARLREELQVLVFGADPDYIHWGEHASQAAREESGWRAAKRLPRTTLHYTPIAVGKSLREMLWGSVSCCVLTSATLANSGGFSYIRSRLSVPDDAIEHIAGSPFDFKRQAVLYVPSHLPSPKRAAESDMADAAAAEIARVVGLTGGRAFLLFTSRRMLNAVYERLKDSLDFPLYRQGDMPPAKLLESFRESGCGVLFGTQTFWEGVDVQGEALSCVVIDRLPFAVPDSPITKARTDAIQAAGGDWFTEYSVPQAQIRLKQGFGRLIRTRTDRGIVCILDSRIHTAHYGPEFVQYLPPASRASLWPRLERLWNCLRADLP